jgi:carbonic anhydrase
VTGTPDLGDPGRFFALLVAANAAYVDSGRHRALPVEPARRLVVVTCMDSRIDAFAALGLGLGDAHVIRTAGARVTGDVLRSLTLSTHVLGTRAVMVLGHTRCGLLDPDGALEERLRGLMGREPFGTDWGTFRDPADAIRSDCARLLQWPDRPEGLMLGGYVLDVDDGRVREIVGPTTASPPST